MALNPIITATTFPLAAPTAEADEDTAAVIEGAFN
jgi:hypothetical protein